MATTVLDALKSTGTHGIGYVNNYDAKTVPYGATVKTASVDNYTLVEITGYEADGVPTCVQLATKTTQGYLVCTPEQRLMGEALGTFYNGIDEMAKLVILEPMKTVFETSSFTKNAGVVTIARGNVAHFDVATKKFIVSTAVAPHANFATSANQFLVKAIEEDTVGNYLVDTIRLVCTK